MEEFKFSPLIDLEKNDKIGLLRFTDHYCLGQRVSAKRIELFEKNVIKYFRSRDEDNIKKPLPTINTTIMTTKPISTSLNNLSNQQQQRQPQQQHDTSFNDDTINSSFWDYPLQYRNETVY